MKRFLLFFLILIYSINANSFAQTLTNAVQNQYSFKSFTVDQGLSNNNILSICQDAKGSIWIGTLNGLNKFNGQTIVTYNNEPKDSTTVSSDIINALFLDSKQNLWIGGAGGLDKYISDLDQFSRFKHPNQDSSLEEIYSIAEDTAGKLWFGGISGLYVYDLNSGEFHSFNDSVYHFKGIPSRYIYRILVDKRNKVWISVLNKGVYVYDQADGSVKIFKNNPNDPTSISADRIERIYEDSKGNIWLGTLNDGLNLFVPETESFKRYIPDIENSYSTRVRAIFEDLKGDLFIGTRGGLYRQNKYTQKFEHYAFEGHNFSNISQNSIIQSFIDKSGTLWLGTFSGGVNYSNLNKKAFVHYIAGKNDDHYLRGSNIYGIIEDDEGNLWVGGDNGLNFLDRTNYTFKYFIHNPNDPTSISYNDVKDIEWDKKGNLWVATNKGGLNYLNIATGEFNAYKHDPKDSTTIAGDKIYCLLNDAADNLWIIISPFNDFQFLYVDVLPSGSDEFIHLNEKCYFGLEQDTRGNIFIGGIDGFWIHNRIDSTFEYLRNKALFENVNVLKVDSKGILWIGSVKGLVRYDMANHSFSLFSEKNGYPISQVFGILEDEKNNLWVSTNTGLVKIYGIVNNVGDNKFKVFDHNDGLQSKQFNYNAFYKSKSGEMMFGGINGFNTFFPDQIVEDTVPAKVIITDLKIFNKSVPIGKKVEGRTVLNKAITATKSIKLGHRQNVFSIEFASPQNANPEKYTFKFILEGFDKDWQYRKAVNNIVSYTNLPAGKYTFKVSAANNDGYWNENPVLLDITIIPPFWKSWWFIISSIVLLNLIAVFLYKNRVKQFKLNEQLLTQAVNERTQELNKSNQELLYQKYEILTQNEEIQSQNDQLQVQQEMIEEKNKALEEVNKTLQFLVEFGEHLTSELNMFDIFSVIEKYIASIIDFDIIGFGKLNKKSREVIFSNYSEDGTMIPQFASSLDDESSIASYCYSNNKELVCNNLNDVCKLYLTEILSKTKEQPLSVLYFPLSLGGKIIGILTIQSYKADAFPLKQVTIVQQLLAYITIAIDNSFAYDLVKQQKEEIEKHKNYLEDIVAERTKNLEIAKNKAEESDKLKSAFLANISHEIRTPLNAIIGFTGLLEDQTIEEIQATNYREIIKKSGISLLQLINDVVDFSKIEAGQLFISKTPHEIQELLKNLFATFNEQYKDSTVKLVLNNCIDEALYVNTDDVRLNQILNNLVSNAYKFTKSGQIQFGIKQFVQNKELVFYVSDTGVGINEKHYNNIFNRFVKIDEDTTTLYRGVGLGLAITKHLVEQLGGKIWVNSEVGKGSEFVFTMPL